MKSLILLALLAGCSSIPKDISETESQEWKYVTDIKKQGVPQYWQSPSHTEKDRTGDCEDFALWKYSQLKDKYECRIAIGKDRKIGHAWLEFKHNNNWFVYEMNGIVEKSWYKYRTVLRYISPEMNKTTLGEFKE